MNRCFGDGEGKEFYAKYHDEEWGVPVHDERHLFEMLILEGMQAGLSWELILKRRENYQKAFYQFDPVKVSKMSDLDLEKCLGNPGLIRNRLKIYSIRKNARVFLSIQQEFGSFDTYIWKFVDFKPIVNHFKTHQEVPCFSELSDQIAKDLKKRGMSFVGTKIIYSFMQAIGMVDDHLETCPIRMKSQNQKKELYAKSTI